MSDLAVFAISLSAALAMIGCSPSPEIAVRQGPMPPRFVSLDGPSVARGTGGAPDIRSVRPMSNPTGRVRAGSRTEAALPRPGRGATPAVARRTRRSPTEMATGASMRRTRQFPLTGPAMEARAWRRRISRMTVVAAASTPRMRLIAPSRRTALAHAFNRGACSIPLQEWRDQSGLAARTTSTWPAGATAPATGMALHGRYCPTFSVVHRGAGRCTGGPRIWSGEALRMTSGLPARSRVPVPALATT